MGNVTVHIGLPLNESASELITKSINRKEKEISNQKELDVVVFNNPTDTDIGIKVSGSYSNVYSVRIMDISGRLIDSRMNLPVGKILRIGSDYKKGMYSAEVRQRKSV